MKYNNNILDRPLTVYIVRMLTLYNAAMMGWKISKVGQNKYKLTKEVNDIDLVSLLRSIVPSERSVFLHGGVHLR